MKELIVTSLFLVILTFPTSALAHLLVTDGTIGAVLHVDPQDNPIAGESSSFYFEFKDTSGKFDPKNCTCTVTISEGSNQVFSTNLFQETSKPSLTSSSFNFAFPKKAVYQLKVVGNSTEGSFESFNLNYDIRVDREIQKSDNIFQKYYHYWHYGLYFLAAAIGIGLIAYERIKSRSKITKNIQKEDHDQKI